MTEKSQQHSPEKRIPGSQSLFNYTAEDLQSGLVVFLVALPLCLGIALASGAPLFSGLIAGMVGGLAVSLLSGAALAVSGPAAGLTVIVLDAITDLGSFELFLTAVIIAGIIQLGMGFLKAGVIANYFPSAVIKGMLAAIGIILILKQLPHAVGYDADYEGDFTFIQTDKENTFTEILVALGKSQAGAVIITLVCLAVMILWEKPIMGKLRKFPGALLAVLLGVGINELFRALGSEWVLGGNHLVRIPVAESPKEFIGQFRLPDLAGFANPQVYVVAGTLAVIASLETLLSIEAIDRLDPYKRYTPPNRELKAQGVGNILCGLIGGLPITAVIVRGSTNVSSGGKTKMASFYHGLLLLLSILFLGSVMNLIPKAALAAILLVIGYKLAKVSLFKQMYRNGWYQFIPFVVTVVAIVLTDLLVGIIIGLVVGIIIILRQNMKNSHVVTHEQIDSEKGTTIKIILAEEVTFLNKASILEKLNSIPPDSHVVIDGSRSQFIDFDVVEEINDFAENARHRNIDLELVNVG